MAPGRSFASIFSRAAARRGFTPPAGAGAGVAAAGMAGSAGAAPLPFAGAGEDGGFFEVKRSKNPIPAAKRSLPRWRTRFVVEAEPPFYSSSFSFSSSGGGSCGSSVLIAVMVPLSESFFGAERRDFSLRGFFVFFVFFFAMLMLGSEEPKKRRD